MIACLPCERHWVESMVLQRKKREREREIQVGTFFHLPRIIFQAANPNILEFGEELYFLLRQNLENFRLFPLLVCTFA